MDTLLNSIYGKLRLYNQDLYLHSNLPKWLTIYTAKSPPAYWVKVFDWINDLPRSCRIVEIGSGGGDVLYLLKSLNFELIVGFEREENLSEIIIKKLGVLSSRTSVSVKSEYPQKVEFVPDVLICVNCVYTDNMATKREYLEKVKEWYLFNGRPKLFIWEVIDSSYKEDNSVFPKYIRISPEDVCELFPDCKIENYQTYKYPSDGKSKMIYKIENESCNYNI